MKAVVTITVQLPGDVERASVQVYDVDGTMLASEASTGFNVTKRAPAALLAALLAQAEQIAADCTAEY